MKKVYLQIIDPINKTSISSCDEYPDEYMQGPETSLKKFGIDYKRITGSSIEQPADILPMMPEYILFQGVVEGTSKLVTIVTIDIDT